MDRKGDQLRYSNRIVNTVSVKNDTKIGFCEMYQNNNGCICMSLNRRNSEFGSYTECNGMCTKQNINIYIENFDTRRSNEKFDPKCKPVNESNYSFYNTVEQGSSNGNTFYTDIAWVQENEKSSSKLNYYPYNRQYLSESLPYVRKHIESKSGSTTNSHPQVAENPAHRDNRSHVLMEEEKYVLNGLHDNNNSRNSRSSSCTNLYVEPPYFTVDKFVNEEKPLITSSLQKPPYCNKSVFHYQRMPANFEGSSIKKSLVQSQSVKDQDLIGIKLVEDSDIHHMHFKNSFKPESLDLMKRTRYLPIKKEKCYDNDLMGRSDFTTETNDRGSMLCRQNFNRLQDTTSNKTNTVSHCNSTSINNLKHDFSHELLPEYYNVTNGEEHQFSTLQTNAKPEIYSKSTSSNVLISSSKNIVRQVRKPNYRELINHVHAMRNSTSEDDLNMQIIKRTLNYNPNPKEIAICNFIPQQFSSKEVSVSNKTNTFDNVSIKKSSNQNKQVNFFENSTTNSSPLDLSVKTVKSNADSTGSDSFCKVIMSENVYPPKFNFNPDFSENRHINNDTTVNTTGHDCCRISLSRAPLEATQTNVVIENPMRVTDCCSQSQNSLAAIGCHLKNELLLQASIPSLESKFVCNFQNCIPVQKCINPEVGRNNGFKVEVTLKRSSHLKSELEEECDKKKFCGDSYHDIDFESSKSNKITDITFKKSPKTLCQNLDVPNLILSTSCTKEITKNELDHNNLIKEKESAQTNNEERHDDSLVNACRIRTKAELKGFTFQEDKGNYLNESLCNKENYYCNTALTQVEDTVDLNEWKNACNSLVDQLINSCKDNHAHKQQKYSDSKKQSNEFKVEVEKLTNISNEKADFQAGDLIAKNINNPPLKTVDINSVLECNQNLSTKGIDKPNLKTDSKSESFMKILYNNSHVSVESFNDSSMVESNLKIKKKHIADKIYSIDDINSFGLRSAINSTSNENGKDNFNKVYFPQNKPSAIDLKKISVVRLKREKYESKRITQKSKDLDKEKQNAVPNSVKNITRNVATKIKSTLEQNISTRNRRQLRFVKSKDNLDLKSSTITTRFRRHISQLNKSDCKYRSNKTHKSEKVNERRCHKNQKDKETANDIDKLYLEVYRYKRALKIPPNLITIKNTCKQGMSSSLPDLDVDIHNTVQNEVTNNNQLNVEEGPKSIIDVLHSRVIKTKNQLKNNQRNLKPENQRSLQPKVGQCNTRNGKFKQPHLNENSNREYRNVFETQILSSRTRTEYKMQLNKEVIREIFGANERPASAPPEINNIKNDFELIFEDHYDKYLNKNNNTFMCEISEQQEPFVVCSKSNTKEENIKKIDITSKNDQPEIAIKYKRKKCGRSHRRKFSSGFDYLRKKKKSKARTLYKYTQLKSRTDNFIAEPSQYIKNESDISREIQKWVLNKSVGQSALHKAARLGYIDVIVYCLERMGLNPDQKDNAGYTPLHDACVKGSLDIVRVLLQYGANHSEGAHSGIRPLHEASENGHMEVVRMLLSYGADPLLETYSGQTPLMLASETNMSDFILNHLYDIQMNDKGRQAWRFPGPWKVVDIFETGYDSFSDIRNNHSLLHTNGKHNKQAECLITETNPSKKNNCSQKSDVCEIEILVDTADAEGELFEFEEANMPLPPLYMLKGEGMEKWVLLSDLCSLLKVKSKDTLLHKIFPSISPSTVSRIFLRELKMCDFLEKATCLQLLCAGERINICHSKVILVQYNENVRKFLGVKTILMKF